MNFISKIKGPIAVFFVLSGMFCFSMEIMLLGFILNILGSLFMMWHIQDKSVWFLNISITAINLFGIFNFFSS